MDQQPTVISVPPTVPTIQPTGFNLKVPILIIAGIFIFAVGIGAKLLAGKYISPPLTSLPSPTPSPSVTSVQEGNPTVNWKTFTNNKSQYFLKYPKNWFVHKETISNSEINTVILTNYPANNTSNTKTTNSNNLDAKLAVRLEITYTKLDGLDARFSEKEKRENNQLNPSSDLHIANLFTNRLYGSNTEGEHFVSYTASSELDKYLSIYVYVIGVVVSDKINELKNTPEWQDLDLIFSSVKFLD